MYQIQSYQTETGQQAHHLCFNASHEVFGAHFPGSPIVPGAVLIDVIRHVAADMLGRNVQVSEVKNVKFITVIVPDSSVTLNISSQYAEMETGYLFKSVISDSERIYAKFDIIVKEA